MVPASQRPVYKMSETISSYHANIFKENLDKETKEKLEMAKRILTWYKDLDSEVTRHFDKALLPKAKQLGLTAEQLNLSPSRAAIYNESPADSQDSSCSAPLSAMLPPSSLSLPSHSYLHQEPSPTLPLPPPLPIPPSLPSLFSPPGPHQPIPIMAYPAYYSCTDEVDPHSPDQIDTTYCTKSVQLQQSQPLMDTAFGQIAPLHVESAVPAFETATCQHHHLPPSELDCEQTPLCDPLLDTEQPPIDTLQPLPLQTTAFPLQPTMASYDSQEYTLDPSLQLPTCQFQEATNHTYSVEQPSPYSLQQTLHSDPETDSQQTIAVDFTFYALSTSHDQEDEEHGMEWVDIENIQLDWTEEEKMELRALLL